MEFALAGERFHELNTCSKSILYMIQNVHDRHGFT
jgi:hypothetical protein